MIGSSSLILVLAVVVYMCYSQYKTKPVKAKSYILTPIILIFIGYQGMKSFHGNLTNYIPVIAVACIICLVLGLVSGTTVKIFIGEDGILYQKGRILSIVLVLLTLGIKALIIAFLGDTQYSAVVQGNMLTMLMLGCQYAGRSATVILREPKILEKFKEERKNKD
ncbi:hypothetical protein [Sarcina ventriculi]